MDFESRNLVIPRGKVLFAQFLPGTQTPGPFRELGNCPEFTMAYESEKLDHYSSQAGMRVKDASVTIEAALTGTVTTDDMKAENIAYWFMGAEQTVTESSATGTEETFEDVAAGDIFQLGRTTNRPSGLRKVASVVITDGAPSDPETFVAGTDYEVDLDLGLITILEGSAAIGGDIEVTYNTTASTRSQIRAGQQSVEGELKFVSFNALGADSDTTIPRASLTPNGDLAMLVDPESNEFQSLSLTIEALKKGNLPLAIRDGRPA